MGWASLNLDFSQTLTSLRRSSIAWSMKTLFLLLVMVISMVRTQATVMTLDGDLTWNVTEPRCSFLLKGNLKNGTALRSGPLKLVLWATPNPFPSLGYIVAEYSLGSIEGGYQFSNFTVKTPSKLPSVSGAYYFTIAVAEYTGGIWRNVLAVRTAQRTLEVGNLAGQQKWPFPTKTVLPPPGLVTQGNFFKLTLKATDEKNLFPVNLQEKTTITVNSKTKLTTKLRFAEKSAKYSYSTQFGKFGSKKVDYSNLLIEYGASATGASKAIYSFYFHGVASGTYRCVETSASGQETTWGTFKFY